MLASLKLIYREFKLDALLYRRQGADSSHAAIFFILVITVFAMGLEPSGSILARVAHAVIWLASLLAQILSSNHILANDQREGRIEAWILSPLPLTVRVLVRFGCHLLWVGLPLWLCAFAGALALQLPRHAYAPLMWGLCLGIPTLALLGMLLSALTLSLKQSGLFLALLALPLYAPVLLIGGAAVESAHLNLAWSGHMALLAAFLLAAMALLPMATAFCLRLGVE